MKVYILQHNGTYVKKVVGVFMDEEQAVKYALHNRLIPYDITSLEVNSTLICRTYQEQEIWGAFTKKDGEWIPMVGEVRVE